MSQRKNSANTSDVIRRFISVLASAEPVEIPVLVSFVQAVIEVSVDQRISTANVAVLGNAVIERIANRRVASTGLVDFSSALEAFLLDQGSYIGYADLFWLSGGMKLWEQDGRPPLTRENRSRYFAEHDAAKQFYFGGRHVTSKARARAANIANLEIMGL